MTYAVSAFHERSDHMSPVAALLAALLHAATAAALILVSPLNQRNIEVPTVEVTIEQPELKPPVQEAAKPQPPPTPPPQPPAAKPAPPPPPPPAVAKAQPERKPQPQPRSNEQLGLPPEAPVKPEEKPQAKPEPKAEPKSAPPTQAAAPPVEPTPPPDKPVEKALPPVEAPPPPLTMRDFVKAMPPPPAPPPSPPAPRPPPPQQLQHSPLSASAPPTEQRQGAISSFQNPADAYAHARTHDDYLARIARRMYDYRYVPKSMAGRNAEGVVVLSLVVARDGRLVSSAIAKSSGNPPMDIAVLESAQKAAPYGPLPAELSGSTVTFTLSVPYKFIATQ